jgi:hypothetical protein
MELAVSESELYLPVDIMTAFMLKGKERSQPALLESDREIRAVVNQIVIRTVVPYKLLDCKDVCHSDTCAVWTQRDSLDRHPIYSLGLCEKDTIAVAEQTIILD